MFENNSHQNGAAGKCAHWNYKVDFQVARAGQQGQALLDLFVICADCLEPFVFTLGNPSPQKLRLAIAPASVVNKVDPTKRIIVPRIVGAGPVVAEE